MLGVAIAALGVAAHVLVTRDREASREEARGRLDRMVAEFLRAVATAPAGDAVPTIVAADGTVTPPAPAAFAPLGTISDPEARFALDEARRAPETAFARAAIDLALRSDDAAARLEAAVCGATGPAAAARDWRGAARVPAELADTAAAVLLGVLAGDEAAMERAERALTTSDDERAAALLLRHADRRAGAPPGAAEAEIERIRRVRRGHADRARIVDAYRRIEMRDLGRPEEGDVVRGAVGILGDGAAVVGVPATDGARRFHVVPAAEVSRIARTRLATHGIRLAAADAEVAPEAVAAPLDVGLLAVWDDAPRPDVARSTTLLAAIAGGALAAVIAFFVFVRAVRREARAAAARTDFVWTVSHELRTPVAVVRTAAETLLAGRAQSESDRATLLAAILRESERLSSLLGNVLDFARIDAGTRRYAFRETTLGALVREPAERIAPVLTRAGLDVAIDVTDGAAPVVADPDAIAAAITNLLDNAAKFRGASARATLRARLDGECVVLEVIDHGIGIAVADRAHVFERFFRSADPRVRETRGSGIGLALVKHTVEAHGGTIEVSDTDAGAEPGRRGTTFRIVLPRERRS